MWLSIDISASNKYVIKHVEDIGSDCNVEEEEIWGIVNVACGVFKLESIIAAIVSLLSQSHRITTAVIASYHYCIVE